MMRWNEIRKKAYVIVATYIEIANYLTVVETLLA